MTPKPLSKLEIIGLALFLLLILNLVLDIDISIKPRRFAAKNQQSLSAKTPPTSADDLEEAVLPSNGAILPIKWGDLGIRMISVGMIDREKLEKVYANRGGLIPDELKLLETVYDDKITMTQENANFLLNLFWALGLGNKNEILEKGPMMTYSGAGSPAFAKASAGSPAEALAKAGNFASTGGWTLARGQAMDHYSRHPFIILTPEQQSLVEKVAKNIYRPCCDNPTHFPDCNHGMAMLGLLELIASQDVAEEEMYRVALKVNSFWFPDTYLAIAKYLESKGIPWNEVQAKEILGYDFSSASGYRRILAEMEPQASGGGGGGCGI